MPDVEEVRRMKWVQGPPTAEGRYWISFPTAPGIVYELGGDQWESRYEERSSGMREEIVSIGRMPGGVKLVVWRSGQGAPFGLEYVLRHAGPIQTPEE